MNWVYGLRCKCHPEDGIRYVGQTGKGIEARLSGHIWRASNPHKGYRHKVYNWMRKHGIENIESVALQECANYEDLNQAEVDWIKRLGTFDTEMGLNMNEGGGGNAGWKHSEKSIQQSVANRVYTDECRAKIGASSSERLKSPEMQARLKAGRVAAKEARIQEVAEEVSGMDDAELRSFWLNNPRKARLMGTVISPTYTRKAGVAPLGSDELRATLSAAMKGTKHAAIISREQAEEIIARLHAGEGQSDIAGDYGLDHAAVSAIYTGKTWAEVPRPWGDSENRKRRFFTEKEAIGIIDMFAGGESIPSISSRLGAKRSRIEKIIYGQTWKGLERPWAN